MGATIISGTELILRGSVGGDIGTTLGSELGMVGGRCDFGGAVVWRRI